MGAEFCKAWDQGAIANFGAGTFTVILESDITVDSITSPSGPSTRTFNQGGAFTLTLTTGNWSVPGGQTTHVNIPIAGTNGINRSAGSGNFNLNTANPGLSGPTVLSGVVNWNNSASLPNESMELVAVNTRFNLPLGSTLTVQGIIAERPDPEAANIVSLANRRIALSSASTTNIADLVLNRSDAATLDYFGKFGNGDQNFVPNVTIQGDYTQIFSGVLATESNNAANLRSEGAVLVFDKEPGKWIWTVAGEIQVAGGEIRLANHGQIRDGQNFLLEAGTLNLNGQQAGDADEVLHQLGTLNLQGTTTIDFGENGAGEIWFADSSALAWEPDTILQVLNYQYGLSHFRIGSDENALTETQLGQIEFIGHSDPVTLNSQGVLIPEPETCLLLGSIFLAGFLFQRRRSGKI